jgi:hypothetical protein
VAGSSEGVQYVGAPPRHRTSELDGLQGGLAALGRGPGAAHDGQELSRSRVGHPAHHLAELLRGSVGLEGQLEDHEQRLEGAPGVQRLLHLAEPLRPHGRQVEGVAEEGAFERGVDIIGVRQGQHATMGVDGGGLIGGERGRRHAQSDLVTGPSHGLESRQAQLTGDAAARRDAPQDVRMPPVREAEEQRETTRELGPGVEALRGDRSEHTSRRGVDEVAAPSFDRDVAGSVGRARHCGDRRWRHGPEDGELVFGHDGGEGPGVRPTGLEHRPDTLAIVELEVAEADVRVERALDVSAARVVDVEDPAAREVEDRLGAVGKEVVNRAALQAELRVVPGRLVRRFGFELPGAGSSDRSTVIFSVRLMVRGSRCRAASRGSRRAGHACRAGAAKQACFRFRVSPLDPLSWLGGERVSSHTPSGCSVVKAPAGAPVATRAAGGRGRGSRRERP